MSKQYETEVTLTINGSEQDVTVRAWVAYEAQPGGCWGGSIDGEIEALVDGEWVLLDLSPRELDRAEEALCDECSNDDRDQCVEWAS